MQFTEKNYCWAEVLSQILLIPHFAKEHTHAYTAISSSGNLCEKLDVKVWKTGAYGCSTIKTTKFIYLRLHLKVATAEQYFNVCKIQNHGKFVR